MTTMLITDFETNRPVVVDVESEQILDDGSVYRIVNYSGYVDCRFAVIEYPSGDIYSQADWQSAPTSPGSIEDGQWVICTPNRDSLVSATEAAEYLGVSRMWVNQLIHDGRLYASRVGRSWTISVGDLLDFEANR